MEPTMRTADRQHLHAADGMRLPDGVISVVELILSTVFLHLMESCPKDGAALAFYADAAQSRKPGKIGFAST